MRRDEFDIHQLWVKSWTFGAQIRYGCDRRVGLVVVGGSLCNWVAVERIAFGRIMVGTSASYTNMPKGTRHHNFDRKVTKAK